MRFLADENIPGLIVYRLRQRQHDVLWVRTDYPGITDEEVLALADADQRVLLTQDKDYGELVFHRGLKPGSGIILLRLFGLHPNELADKTVEIIESQPNWAGLFVVVEEDRVRVVSWPRRQ